MERNTIPIDKQKTTTATYLEVYDLVLRRLWRPDTADPNGPGRWWIEISQPYQFLGADGQPVPGIQKHYQYQQSMPETEFQTAYPKLYSQLASLWLHAQATIKAQEEIP